jgi:phage-related protein
MTARNYDFILTVANASQFIASNTIIGLSSKTSGLIVNVDVASSNIKVKLSNSRQEFISGERVISNATLYITNEVSVTYSNTTSTTVNGNSYTINGSTNTFSLPASNLVNFYKDAISVSINGFNLPQSAWVYPSITSLGNYGVTIKPLNYLKTIESDSANLIFKLNDVIKSSYYTTSTWAPGDPIGDITSVPVSGRDAISDFSQLLSNTDLSLAFVGTQSDIDNKTMFSWVLPTANTANVTISLNYGSTSSSPFFPGYKKTEIETANTTVSSITNSLFISAKNALQQQPLVRLYSVYYTGEWYPAKTSGNPDTSQNDVDYPWPAGFPIRIAEIRGDYVSDIAYRIRYGGVEYQPYPINSTGISLDSSGKINDVSFIVSNFDGMITSLIENPYLCGYNSSNNTTGIVNGETVYNIDARTNPSNVVFDSGYTEELGLGYNVAWTYSTTTDMGDTWVPLKQDTRDLLGGIVEIKTTFADLLDFWPEYSSILEKNGNYVKVRTTSPYRIGDIVHTNANTMSSATVVVENIVHPYLLVSNSIALNPGENLYIKNPNASSDEFVLDTFKINNLEGLDESAAKFSLTSWLQYFKQVLPRRLFHKNTCVWSYGGAECQYPRNTTSLVPGTNRYANGWFYANNVAAPSLALDVCAKTDMACRLRNNEIHFSSFPGTGTSTPK